MDTQMIMPEIWEGDCLRLLDMLDDNSVHLVLTDPPYFLDKLDDAWAGAGKAKRSKVVGGKLPDGMAFSPQQGRNLHEFLRPVCEELLRVLAPGGFCLMFASPRLAHRTAMPLEEAGFEIRDIYAWHYTKQAQYKAFTLDHFVKKADATGVEKTVMLARLNGARTPQLRPQYEPVVCAQKPREGTFLANWLEWQVGLVNDLGEVPTTVMKFEKDRRDPFNTHITPKPLALCEYLIRLFSQERHTVLDPFLGSGTTCLAAMRTGRFGIGAEMVGEHADIAVQRVQQEIENVQNTQTAG